MKWTISHNGNSYAKQGDVLALVQADADSDDYSITLKITNPFDDEDEAKAVARDMLLALRDAELTHFYE